MVFAATTTNLMEMLFPGWDDFKNTYSNIRRSFFSTRSD